MLTIETTSLVRDEGTVVMFEGIVQDVGDSPYYTGQTIRFAVDHHMAQDIANALADPSAMPPLVYAEEWQVMR